MNSDAIRLQKQSNALSNCYSHDQTRFKLLRGHSRSADLILTLTARYLIQEMYQDLSSRGLTHCELTKTCVNLGVIYNRV